MGVAGGDGRLVVAITGASGVIYGLRLIRALLDGPRHGVTRIHLLISRPGRMVLSHETGYDGGPMDRFLRDRGIIPPGDDRLTVHDPDDLFAPPASGSYRHAGMAVCPCSMRTLGAISAGVAGDLIGRAADVCIKERRPLILVTRETPLSPIHLENMLRAARAGATIMPPCPGFYHHPRTVDDLVDATVGRVLDHLGIGHRLVAEWGGDGLNSEV